MGSNPAGTETFRSSAGRAYDINPVISPNVCRQLLPLTSFLGIIAARYVGFF